MLSRSTRRSYPSFAAPLFLALLTFCMVLPLVLGGPSCGHDFGFHMQSWMDAADQLRHGHVLPRWAFSPAFNAGEPRFIFYPPVSWLTGSLLLLLLPPAAVPVVYTWFALTGAACAMYALARRFSNRSGAMLAAAIYVANPYVLFTAFERTAYAELLAAAWLPLLFRAALAEQISALAVAIPLALLWLTNAPAAVMGTYALAVLVLCRAFSAWRQNRSLLPEDGSANVRILLVQAAGGLLLGLALAGFYLLPAAYERRYVQIAMAIIPNMRVEDNFLFGHTGYGPHDQVLHTASLVALETMAITAIALLLAIVLERKHSAMETPVPKREGVPGTSTRPALVSTLCLAILIAVLLWHPTVPVWHLLPELAFLQFPWRLLAVLGCVLGLAAAIALGRVRMPVVLASVTALTIAGAATTIAIRPFREACEARELLPARISLFQAHHGVGPTDEYTPITADNDQLRWDDPAWWLAASLNDPGPNTVPNPAATIVDYDEPPPLNQTVSGHAPTHLQVHLSRPANLVLNLRDYPAWHVTVNDDTHPVHLQRDDGLLALALPAGNNIVDIRWRTLPDMWAGDGLSVVALLTAGWLRLRSRRIVFER
ncbi:MAG: hypothetical protein ACRYFU_18090 [Janthinobacterium lividum]